MDAFPLQWPDGYPRTNSRRRSRFVQTLAATREYVKQEVKNIGGTGLVISTNIPTKDNGDLRADFARFKITDPGVAVYFTRNNTPVVLCCDTYNQIWENLYAVGRTIEALRQINRDGVSDFLNRTFTGFKALPESTLEEKNIWDILGLAVKPSSKKDVEDAYKERAKIVHPDRETGSVQVFQDLNDAYQKALKFYQ